MIKHPKGETKIFEHNIHNSNLNLTKRISWDPGSLLEEWKMERTRFPIVPKNTEPQKIQEHPDR